MKHKAAGYGVFFMILERLREEPEYMSVKDYNMIAFDLREDTSLIKSVIEDFGLFVFTEDGKYFYSESFKRRMEIKDEKSRKRSNAGKKGMANRWCDSDDITNGGNYDNNDITNQVESITRKEKERKGKKSKEISPVGDTKKSAPSGASPSPYPPNVYEKDLQECKSELFSDQMWIEVLCMNNHLSKDQLAKYLNNFFMVLQNRGERTKSIWDAKHHFASWLQIELKEKGKKDARSNGNLGSLPEQPAYGED